MLLSIIISLQYNFVIITILKGLVEVYNNILKLKSNITFN